MIVLDTHIWLWWINEEVTKLGSTRKEQIESSDMCLMTNIPIALRIQYEQWWGI